MRRARGQRQDDDARRARGLAGRDGGPTRGDHRVAFNKRAAEELTARLDAALEPLGVALGAVRVRTFHALGRELLAEPASRSSRSSTATSCCGARARAGPLLIGGGSTSRSRDSSSHRRRRGREVAADPTPGPVARAFIAYEAAVAATGGLDFDDLVVRALRLLEADAAVLRRWRERCAELLVDEAQDLDRTQLELALLLAAPAQPGLPRRRRRPDDLRLAPGRCAPGARPRGVAPGPPAGRPHGQLPVPARRSSSVPSGSSSTTASGSPSGSARGPAAAGRLVLAPDAADDIVRIGARDGELAGRRRDAGRPRPDEPRAPRRRSRPPSTGVPFRPPPIALLVEAPRVDALPRRPSPRPTRRCPLLARLAAVRSRGRRAATTTPATDPERDRAAEIAARAPRLGRPVRRPRRRSREAIDDAPAPTRELCRDDAPLTLATAHGTKGLEFDHVAVIGSTRPLPEPPVGHRRHRAGAGARGGAPPRVRRLDPRPALAHPRLRPGCAVAVPARGVHAEELGLRARGWARVDCPHGRPDAGRPQPIIAHGSVFLARPSGGRAAVRPLVQRLLDVAHPCLRGADVARDGGALVRADRRPNQGSDG